MAIKKCIKKELDFLTKPLILDLGFNMLEGCKCEIIDTETCEKANTRPVSHDLVAEVLLNRKNVARHIDIECEKAELIFDLGSVCKANKLLFSGFFCGYANYTIAEFELYASDTRDDLFKKENMFVHEKNYGTWVSGQRNNADWLYDVEGELRYLGVKIIKSNESDNIIRIADICIYNDEFTYKRKYPSKKFEKNILHGLAPICVTDDVIYDDDDSFKINELHTFTFPVDSKNKITKVWVITDGACKIKCLNTVPVVTQLEKGRFEYTLNIEHAKSLDELDVTVIGNVSVELIGAFSGNREVSVDFSESITDNYLGIGANCLPMSFMPESLESGYNEVYWELEKRRILLTKPNVVRMWFQVDWVVEEYENYKSGIYDFNTQKMQSVYKYLDVLKECGSEIEFNFGWKVSTNTQEWFGFPNLRLPRNSAPRELDLFAKCCGATLYELVKNRGYDNIKYLTFYNEPSFGRDRTDYGEFVVIGEKRIPYWEKMLKLCRAEVEKRGIEVEYWGTEEGFLDWIEYFEERKLLDCHTAHKYLLKTKEINEYFGAVKKIAKNTPIVLTECGQYFYFHDSGWELNHIQLLCDITNAGVAGALIWTLNSMHITDPCSFYLCDAINMWDCPQVPHGIDNVREVYYEWAMLTHYIPNHCTSVKTSINVADNDVRACAFKTSNGDYTVIIELNESKEKRDIEVKLDTTIGKKLYKHIYKRPYCRNANATLPPVCGVLEVEDKICETVSGDYQAIVYTTIPPVGQIELSTVLLNAKPGETATISATTIDCDGAIKWEIVNSVGDINNISFTNSYDAIIVSENANVGDMYAVKAYSEKDISIYSIMIVKVI